MPSVRKATWFFALREAGVGLFLLLLCAVTIAFHPEDNPLLSVSSLVRELDRVSVVAIAATGMTFVIISGGIDISAGACLALTACVAGWVIQSAPSVGLAGACAAGVLAGVLVGSVNGFLITFGAIPPIIVTLGMMGVIRGLLQWWTSGDLIYSLPGWFLALARTKIASSIVPDGIPLSILIALLVVLLGHVMMSQTTFGRMIYAVGSDRDVAERSGLPVSKVNVAVYVLCSALVGLAAMIQSAQIDQIDPNAGKGFELEAIAVVVVGGTNIFGGEGSVIGTFLGALLVEMIKTSLNIFGVPVEWEKVAVGLLIIGAVTVDLLLRRAVRRGKVGMSA